MDFSTMPVPRSITAEHNSRSEAEQRFRSADATTGERQLQARLQASSMSRLMPAFRG